MDSFASGVIRKAAVAILIAVVGIPAGLMAQTHVVSPAELQQQVLSASQTRQQNLQKVDSFLSSAAAAKALATASIDPQEVKTAVSSLSDAELAQIAAKADRAQKDFAAGDLSERDLLLLILGVAVLVLIIVAVRSSAMLLRASMRLALVLVLGGSLLAAELPGVWLDVPFIAQSREGCGSASLAMVMQYWLAREQQRISPAAQEPTIYKALYSPKAGGIYASDLERYLRENGFRALAFRGSWDDLRHHLQEGRPLVVALEPGDGAPLHYVVVAGMDWTRDLVMVNDPAGRKLMKRDRRRFEQQWESAGNWTLLALPQVESH
jgi:predicted double-glycine peptidase